MDGEPTSTIHTVVYEVIAPLRTERPDGERGGGMRWAELQELTAAKAGMIVLDLLFWSQATVGGVVADGFKRPSQALRTCEPYLVIGMQFWNATAKWFAQAAWW